VTDPQELADFFEPGRRFFDEKFNRIEQALLSTGDPVGVCLAIFCANERGMTMSGAYESWIKAEETAKKINEHILLFTEEHLKTRPNKRLIIYGGQPCFKVGERSLQQELCERFGRKAVLDLRMHWSKQPEREVISVNTEKNRVDLALARRDIYSSPLVNVQKV
jgi:hypothetical protein